MGSHSFRAGSKVSSSNSTSWLYYIPQTCALSTCQPASKSWSQTCSCYTSTDSLVPISCVSILRFIYLKSNFTRLLKVPPSNFDIYFLYGHFATLLTFLFSKSTPTWIIQYLILKQSSNFLFSLLITFYPNFFQFYFFFLPVFYIISIKLQSY